MFMPSSAKHVRPSQTSSPAGGTPTSRRSARITQKRKDTDVEDSGFALVEVIVAAAIFGIVSTAAVLGITAGISTSSITQQRVVTANVAQQAIEQAVTVPRATLTASPTAVSTVTVGSAQYKVTRSISYSPGTATACPSTIVVNTPYAIVVHVTAVPVTGSSRSVAMDTVIAC